MDTATQNAVPKIYIPEWLKLGFFNNSNLKTDIQNRICDNVSKNFYNALNDIKGDTNNGTDLTEITLLALAYFYSEIFTDKKQNQYYTLEMVKGFFDADNKTTYTAIHEIDVVCYKLNDAPLFKHCWLIIQTAWFFNSQYFGHHQHIDYVNNYILTGQKLPIENYNFDRNYLEKKYNDVDNAKTKKIPINGFTLVNKWYYGILFLICKELNLSTNNFVITDIDNRQYNPLTKTSRQLRALTPFRLNECDIKSAFPTFLDIEAGASLKDNVYNNLMRSKNITRTEAKILFNKVCNSSKYKSESLTIDFFKSCGYSDEQIKILITLTHNKDKKFISFMTEYEALAISHFITMNDLKRGARLHDAILFIDDKTKPQIFKVHPNCDFGYKELNRAKFKESFAFSNKRLNFAYINSIPKGLNLILKVEYQKPEIKGTANGFKFYLGKYEYFSASFNINNYTDDYNEFIGKCNLMFSTLVTLNNKRLLKPFQILLILQHIRQNSNYIFNVRALYSKVKTINPVFLISKKRNYDIVEKMTFKKNIDFVNAKNEAEKLVNIQYNYKDLFDLLIERLDNNDYSYINELSLKGRKQYNLLSFALIRYFNFLCTGQQRKQRKQVNSYPLYSTIIKSVTLNALSLPNQQQNAFVQKQIKKYERELKQVNRLVNNRTKVNQMIFLLIDITGLKNDVSIKRNNKIVNELKTELLNIIDKENKTDRVKEFNELYPKVRTNETTNISDLNNIFDTDMSKSIFNQIDVKEANERGILKEYLKFHNLDKQPQQTFKTINTPKYVLPEIDFNAVYE